MRENKRYLKLSGDFNKKDVEEIILRYIGILGYSRASPMFVKKNILAVNRSEVEKIKASFVLSKKIKVVKVSGTIKGLEK